METAQYYRSVILIQFVYIFVIDIDNRRKDDSQSVSVNVYEW